MVGYPSHKLLFLPRWKRSLAKVVLIILPVLLISFTAVNTKHSQYAQN